MASQSRFGPAGVEGLGFSAPQTLNLRGEDAGVDRPGSLLGLVGNMGIRYIGFRR